MENYIETELGLLSRDNSNWVYTHQIINARGQILDNMVLGISQKWVYLYAYFSLILADVKEKIATPSRDIILGTNEYVELMRTGELEIVKEIKGKRVEYRASYPKVDDIVRVGKQIFVDKQGAKGNKVKGYEWD